MATKKRRTRSPHPGVKLKSRVLPSGGVRHFARFIDPDTGRETDVTLDPVALTTATARTQWAKDKAKAIARRKMELESGAARIIRKTTKDAIAEYKADLAARLTEGTQDVYGAAVDRFAAWAKRSGVEHTFELTKAHLDAFRTSLITAKRVNVKRGGKRGERAEGDTKRSPHTVNIDIRSVRTMINKWRVAGLVPSLDRDAIAEAMKVERAEVSEPKYLAPHELQKLLQACLRHDADCFVETRKEHRGLRPVGTTQRYQPIAPFTAVLLLSGMRKEHGRELAWSRVDLDALDHASKRVGQIVRPRVTASQTKKYGHVVFDLCPSLLALFAALKLRAGNAERVFDLSEDTLKRSNERLVSEYGAPAGFTWKLLRSTCATYIMNSNVVQVGDKALRESVQLGHSIEVANEHYITVHRGIDVNARTLEAAMRIESEMREIVARISNPQTASPVTAPTIGSSAP
jgi:hypothetical protein